LEAERADYRAVLAAVGALGGRVDGLSERVDGHIERVEGVEVKTDANREAINALGEKLAGFQVETRGRFDAVEHKIDAHELLRLRAHTLTDPDARAAGFGAAVDLARRQGAPLFELRAALDDFELRASPRGRLSPAPPAAWSGTAGCRNWCGRKPALSDQSPRQQSFSTPTLLSSRA
jgi:hypothetical protein